MSDVPSPKSARARLPRLLDPKLILGVVFVVASMVLGAQVITGADDTIAVWAAAEDLEPGSPVTGDVLVVKRVRFAEPKDASRYLTAAAGLPERARTTRAVGAGELLPQAAVTAAQDPNLLDFPVPVERDLTPDGLSRGDVVDVYVVPTSADAQAGARPDVPQTDPVLTAVRVLSAGGDGGLGGPAGPGSGGQRVTVRLELGAELTVAEVGAAAAAIANGTPYLVRHPMG